MKSYTIHLIRHGITEGNLLGQYIGITDSPLSQQGIEQLLQKKEAGGYPQAQAYYTSPLSRCVDTLKLLYPDVHPTVVEDFRECNFGDWEGKSAKDLEKEPAFSKWVEQGGDMIPPGGESGGQFMHRTCLAFEAGGGDAPFWDNFSGYCCSRRHLDVRVVCLWHSPGSVL